MGVSRSTAMLAAAGVAAVIGLGSPAGAQTIQGGYEFRVSNAVSPSQPTATVEVWAWFDFVPGVSELFAFAEFDLVASEGEWWGNFVFPLGHSFGTGAFVRGNSISVIVGQLHAPPFFFGDPSNPLWIFAAQWRTTDFTPRSVALVTDNTIRFLVMNNSGNTTRLELSNVVPGSGEISVVPAPGSLLVLSGALVMARRRRRYV